MAVVLFIVGALVLAFSLFFVASYKLAKHTPYQTAIRAWVVGFALELVAWPVLYPLTDIIFPFSTHSPWLYLLFLLLVSILPALVGLQYDRLRKQLATRSAPTQKLSSKTRQDDAA